MTRTVESSGTMSVAKMLVHQPDGDTNPCPLHADRPNAIGRAPESDIRLMDEHSSRQHCVVQWLDNRWVLTDLGSRNGTLVNGERVRKQALQEGDVIVVGNSWLVFTSGDAHGSTGTVRGDYGLDSDTSIQPAASVPVRRNTPMADDSVRMGSALDETVREDRTPAMRRRRRELDPILGESAALQSILDQVASVAPTDSTVLLRGESGVGKELVAREIHRQSLRRQSRFICVNCAALTESLLESEIFGHERGAFTGATEQKRGKFEQADQGTLFLDEIGEMSPAIQAKFLRVLEGHAFERVGGHTPIQVDVRVIAATNADLEAAVREGRFRRELYFRLNVLPIDVPSLRDRKEDIPLLAEYFLRRFAEQADLPIPRLTAEAVRSLNEYNWPGNVRELKNTLERAVVLRRAETIDADDLDLHRAEIEHTGGGESRYEALSIEAIEMQHILRTLRHTKWNKSKAASILGIERSTLDRKLKRHNVDRPDEFCR